MLVAVVVTFAAPDGMLATCCTSLRVGGGVDRIIVVDTGGAAGDVDADELIVMENRGYGAAANVGFAAAAKHRPDAVALLNDDVIVRPGWAAAAVAELDASAPTTVPGPSCPVGVVQPVLLAPGGGAVASLGVELDRYGAGHDVGRDDPLSELPPHTTDLAVFTAGAIVCSPAFLAATGGFDERWFLYYEDVDLALRGRELGWSYRLVPDSRVEHVGGATTSTDAGSTRYWQERNRLWCAARHLGGATWRRAVWLSIRRLRHQPRRVHARALIAGLAGSWPRRVTRGDRPHA